VKFVGICPAHSRRGLLTAEKNTASKLKRFTICTVKLKAPMKISGEAFQLSGASICVLVKPAADKK